MARQGRFGRATAGSQNLSALIYSLLREERNDQEDTMIRSYRNNMRGGVSTNTFSSGGTTTSATAASVYQWYLSQAELARQSGDNTGYNSLIQRAEEFRIAALGDQETLLSNAFANGTTIDFSLFGGTGSGSLTLPQFENLMTNLSNNPSLTEADRSRIRLTLFTASLNSTAGQLGREYDEGTKTANDLVAFYDKELERARAAGITTDSQLYQNLLNARSRYIKAGQVDAANARIKGVTDGIKDETMALAQGLQTYLAPIFDKRIKSQSTIDRLKGTIKDGTTWLNTLMDALNQDRTTTLYQLIYDAAVAGNYGQEEIDRILESASVYSEEAKRLAALYPAEAKDLLEFANELGYAASLGGFQALGRGATQAFQDDIARSGGSVGLAGTSDPYATTAALKKYAEQIGVISENPTYDEMTAADRVYDYANGNFGIGTGDGTVKSIIDELSSTYPTYDKMNMITALATLLSGSEEAWRSNDALYRTVGRWLQGNGVDPNDLLGAIDPTIGGVTVGQVMQYAVESEATRMVDEDPNLVFAYEFVPAIGAFRFTPRSVSVVKTDTRYMAYTTTGKGQEIVYVQRQKLKVDGAGETSIFFIPVPGGESSFGAGAAGTMDSNDYVEFMIGTSTVRLTRDDIEDIETHSGQVIGLPSVSTDGTGQLLISRETERALIGMGMGSPVVNWLYSEAETRGDDWFSTKFVANKNDLGNTSGMNDLLESYVSKITPLAQSRGETVDLATIVTDYLKSEGINDKTGRLTTLIVAKIDPIVYTGDERREWWRQWSGNGGRGGGMPVGVVPPWEDNGVSYNQWLGNTGGGGYGSGYNPNYRPLGPIIRDDNPVNGPVNLTPNVPGTGFDPNALPGYANPNQLSVPTISMPPTPQLGGDFFFRKINTPGSASGPTLLGRPSKFAL
jgi:hypothetical protein